MAAWQHTTYWSSGDYYSQYRKYVAEHGSSYRNRTEDGADISIILLIEFAASHGLTVTLTDNTGVIYCSKATRQYPDDERWLHSWRWSSKAEYIEIVRRRIGSKSLLDHNTVDNPEGPQVGDLMIKVGHTALVLAWYPPGKTHPFIRDILDGTIPIFPGPDVAKSQLYETAYFRESPIGPPSPTGYFDYLNHRGEGNPPKDRAELIYNASVDAVMRDGFKFRMYAQSVLRDWANWDGRGPPPTGGEGAGAAVKQARPSALAPAGMLISPHASASSDGPTQKKPDEPALEKPDEPTLKDADQVTLEELEELAQPADSWKESTKHAQDEMVHEGFAITPTEGNSEHDTQTGGNSEGDTQTEGNSEHDTQTEGNSEHDTQTEGNSEHDAQTEGN